MTEKTETQAKRNYGCACATGDLSVIEPVVVADETTAETDETEPSQPPAAVAPGTVDEHKTRG